MITPEGNETSKEEVSRIQKTLKINLPASYPAANRPAADPFKNSYGFLKKKRYHFLWKNYKFMIDLYLSAVVITL